MPDVTAHLQRVQKAHAEYNRLRGDAAIAGRRRAEAVTAALDAGHTSSEIAAVCGVHRAQPTRWARS